MPIQRRTINGRETNPIGLGCMSLSWAYSGRPSEEDGIRLLQHAVGIGYDHFDTARLYGLGHNETQVGTALKGRRDKVFLASKMGIFASGDKRGIDCHPDTIRSELEVSLRLLQTDHIDLYYMHRRDFTVPIEDSVGAMADLVKEGKVRHIALSEAGPQTIRRAAKVHPIAALQSEYSLWEREVEDEILDVCRENGIGFVPYSPLGRGFLAGTITSLDDLPADDWRRNDPRYQGDNFAANMKVVEAISSVAAKHGASNAQIALAWLLAKGDDIVPIPGFKRRMTLEDSARAVDLVLDLEDLETLETAAPVGGTSGPRYGERGMKMVRI